MMSGRHYAAAGVTALLVLCVFALLSRPGQHVQNTDKLDVQLAAPPPPAQYQKSYSSQSSKENSVGKMKIKDLEPSPVWSALSKIGGQVRDKSLPELINVDYEPIDTYASMNYVQFQDSLVGITLQRQIICTNWEMFGRKSDGGWPVCKAAALAPKKPCVVYSFGIQNDWSFDDAYRDAYGCKIRTFDPSMSQKEHQHSTNVMFYPVGLSNAKARTPKGWQVDSLLGLLTRFNEQNITIPYLKFDVESFEWRVLDNMINDGVLKRVVQLSFEIHVDDPNKSRQYFQIFKKLERLGFRRWFYHHRLNGFSFQNDQSYININYLK